jgi:tetratricopeptide (TPR) repeat protein
MELTIEQALQQGVAAHKEGKLEDAERLYRAILQSQPEHPDANHNLGLIAVSVNNTEAALPLFKSALGTNPEVEQFWLSYINALVKEKQFETVKQVLEQAKKQGVDAEKLNPLEEQLLSKIQKPNIVSVSPPQELLDSLLWHYQNGRYGVVKSLAASITQEFPKHQYGWKMLGAALKECGRISDSLVPSQKSVQLAPQDAGAHSNLGNTLKLLGKLEEAEVSYNQAIALKPDDAGAHSNLGVTLQVLGRLDEAEASHMQAIALKPDLAVAYTYLGVTLRELGKLDEAQASHTQAIALEPDFAEALYHLSIVQGYMNNLEASILSLQNILRIDSDDYGLRAGVDLAICNFLKGDFSNSKRHLLKAAKIQEKTSSEFHNERAYQKYLLGILSWHEEKYFNADNRKTDKILYVIGESHSLVSHHLHVQSSDSVMLCKAKLIKGCQQWHLGNSVKNKFKNQFESVFCSLPKSSDVLLAIGEIDCRLNSGIIKHKNKFPEKKIEEIIVTTVENYLIYIVKNNSGYQHNIIIQGVPCPNIEIAARTEKEQTLLVEVIRKFNCELKNKSKEKGFGFLDVHKLTDRGDGLSNTIWHIDQFHLSPEGFLEAWGRYVSE